MLELAYKQNEEDPYIIDSVGWGYYLTEKFEEAETNSHEFLVKTSGDYIEFDGLNDEINALQDEISQLREDLLEAQKENAELAVASSPS